MFDIHTGGILYSINIVNANIIRVRTTVDDNTQKL